MSDDQIIKGNGDALPRTHEVHVHLTYGEFSPLFDLYFLFLYYGMCVSICLCVCVCMYVCICVYMFVCVSCIHILLLLNKHEESLSKHEEARGQFQVKGSPHALLHHMPLRHGPSLNLKLVIPLRMPG